MDGRAALAGDTLTVKELRKQVSMRHDEDHDEERIDMALDESFPASDPPMVDAGSGFFEPVVVLALVRPFRSFERLDATRLQPGPPSFKQSSGTLRALRLLRTGVLVAGESAVRERVRFFV